MKKFLFSAAMLAAATGTALAADLPSRKEPVILPPPPPLWTGFYVGLNAGGTWTDSNNVNVVTAPLSFDPANLGGGSLVSALSSSFSGTGFIGVGNGAFIGGGQVGYNYQFYTNFLVGLEADIQGIAGGSNNGQAGGLWGITGFPANSISTAFSASKNIDYLGTVRGRFGWLFAPTWLVYGAGGLAYGGVNSNVALFQAIGGPSAGITRAFGTGASFSDTRVGWTAGGGVEWLFMPNWSAKAEYLYYDLGTVSFGLGAFGSAYTAPAATAFFFSSASRATTQFNGHIIRAGVNYHFNWTPPSPVVAKF